MEKFNIFEYLDYKKWLQEWLNEEGRGSVSRLADAIECQRSYISQVINTHVHLTLDQAFKIGKIALENSIERKFLSLLVELGRAGDQQYKTHLLGQLDAIRNEASRLENIVGRNQQLEAESAAIYYSAWYFSAIHIATSLEPPLSEELIATGLNLDVILVKSVLRSLEQYGLVTHNGKHYRFRTGGHHLQAESPHLAHFHQMWRQKSVSNFVENKTSPGARYTLVQSISKKDFIAFESELRELIKKFEQMATPSTPEVVINFNLDFTKVLKS